MPTVRLWVEPTQAVVGKVLVKVTTGLPNTCILPVEDDAVAQPASVHCKVTLYTAVAAVVVGTVKVCVVTPSPKVAAVPTKSQLAPFCNSRRKVLQSIRPLKLTVASKVTASPTQAVDGKPVNDTLGLANI